MHRPRRTGLSVRRQRPHNTKPRPHPSNPTHARSPPESHEPTSIGVPSWRPHASITPRQSADPFRKPPPKFEPELRCARDKIAGEPSMQRTLILPTAEFRALAQQLADFTSE